MGHAFDERDESGAVGFTCGAVGECCHRRDIVAENLRALTPSGKGVGMVIWNAAGGGDMMERIEENSAMTLAQLEHRLAKLEREFAAISGKAQNSSPTTNAWIDEIHGTFQDDE